MARRFKSRCDGWAIAVLMLATGGLAAQTSGPAWKIQTTDRQTVDARISYEIHTKDFMVNRWMVYVPEPPELPSQTKIKATVQPASKLVTEKSALARKVHLIDIPVLRPMAGSKLQIDLKVHALLRSRMLVPLDSAEKPPKAAALKPAEQKYYTAPGPIIDFDASPFQE